jgi:hypothetical protein
MTKEVKMKILPVVLFISIFSIFETYAGPKNFNGVVHKHTIFVTESGQENPEEEEAEEDVALVSFYYESNDLSRLDNRFPPDTSHQATP